MAAGRGASGAAAKRGQDITGREKAEAQLCDSGERYRILVEASPDVIITIGLTGKITSASKAMFKVLGYNDSEFIGKNIREFIPREELPNVLRALADSLRGKQSPGFITRIKTKGVGIVTVEASGAPLFEGMRPVGFIGVLRDITEHRKAEEALKSSEETLHALFDAVPESFLLMDTAGKVLAANSTVAKRLGRDVSALLGMSMFKLLPSDTARIRRQKFDECIRTRKMVRFEDVRSGRHIESTIYPIPDSSGKVTQIAVLGIDITERRKAEEALRESETRFREIFESTNDAIFIADAETRKLVDCNKKAEELIGRPKAQILSMRADELHPKDRVKETMEGFRKQAMGEIDIVETEVLAKSGKRIPVDINAASFRLGGRGHVVGIFRDITDLKKAGELQKEYGAKLEKEVAERTAELEKRLKQLEEFKEFAIRREKELAEVKKRLAKQE